MGTPPAAVLESLRGLRLALDESEIPAKRIDRNLLIATWNVRALGGLTERWEAEPEDSPKRNVHDLYAIAEIVSRFDVVAIQEARGNLTALRRLMGILGSAWGLMLTDVTEGKAGNDERLAFICDLRRVRPSGLACELVVPEEWLAESEDDALEGGLIRADALHRQFARTPYAVSFEAAGRGFVLTALHVWYGQKPVERQAELRTIAEWLARWSESDSAYHRDLICLGDFNIDRKGDPNWEAFAEQGLRSPPELDEALRTISDRPGKASFYDQVAWFWDDERSRLDLPYTGRAGSFAWTEHVLQSLEADEKSWRISDHLPLWAEFSVRAE
ncbi:MAG: endonuclease/exonuclease/phosphatase family protein [Solirubrobacteraceae bacterium]